MMLDPRVHVVQGLMCLFKKKSEHDRSASCVQQETRWITSSRDTARVLKGHKARQETTNSTVT